MKGYGCLPRTAAKANFRFNPPEMLLGIGRKSNHGVIASMGLEMSPQNHSFFSVACAKKPSSCRCILASEKYSAGVEVLAM